jgi:hypothetical protein
VSTYPKRTALDAATTTYWRKLSLDYDGANYITYLGKHREANAPDSDTSHVISKFSYDGAMNIIKIQTLLGAWTDRISLAW